jgi:glycine/D-amino acid oxidase-like deaminating enzyme
MADRPHVLIVGAGIIGASIAWHLLRAGARVTVVDADEPGGVATRNSWAWINASWGNPEPYFRLRLRGMQEWRRLQHEVPGLQVAWNGGLIWELPPEQLETFAVEHAAWGYDIRRVGRAEAHRIEPNLAVPPAFALHAPTEGSVEPLAAAQAILAGAQALGATILAHTSARSIDVSAGRAIGIETDRGRIGADEVIVAGGTGTAPLLATMGVHLPIAAPAALLVGTRPHTKLLNGLVMPPAMQLRQTAEGRLLAAVNLDCADPSSGDGAAAEVLDAMKTMFVSGATLSAEFHVVARRPIPTDNFPVVGRIDGIGGLYAAVMHSGMTLAPVIGQFVAEELLTGRRDGLLDPYGTGRFLQVDEGTPLAE